MTSPSCRRARPWWSGSRERAAASRPGSRTAWSPAYPAGQLVVPPAQRVGRRGHRLEADDVVGPGREYLRSGVALVEVHLDAPTAARDREHRPLWHLVEAVVEFGGRPAALCPRAILRSHRSECPSRRPAGDASSASGAATPPAARRGSAGTGEIRSTAAPTPLWSVSPWLRMVSVRSARVTSSLSRCGNGKLASSRGLPP